MIDDRFRELAADFALARDEHEAEKAERMMWLQWRVSMLQRDALEQAGLLGLFSQLANIALEQNGTRDARDELVREYNCLNDDSLIDDEVCDECGAYCDCCDCCPDDLEDVA